MVSYITCQLQRQSLDDVNGNVYQHRRLDIGNDWDAVNSQQRIKVIGHEEQVTNNALKDLTPNFSCPAVLDIGKTISILQSLDQPASKRFCGPQLLQQSINSSYGSSHTRHRSTNDNIILRPYASSVWKTPRYSNGSSWKRRLARTSSLSSNECEYNQGNRLSPPHSPILRPASESLAMFSSTDWNHVNTVTSSMEKVAPVVKANDDIYDRNEHVSRFTVTRCKSQPCFPTEDNKDNKRHQLKRQRSDEGLLIRPALDFMKMKETAYNNFDGHLKDLNCSGFQSQVRLRTEEMNISFREKKKIDSKNEPANERINADEIGQVTANCDASSQNCCPEIAPSCRDFDNGNSIANFHADGIDSEIDLKAIENDCLEPSDY